MKTTRRRVGALVEWAVAASLLTGVFALTFSLFGEIRRVAPVVPVSAREPDAPLPPPIVPPRAVSVPVLPLPGNLRVEVGELASAVFSRLNGVAQAGAHAVERTRVGQRQTREFWQAGRRFFVVAEDAGGPPRITAIFVP